MVKKKDKILPFEERTRCIVDEMSLNEKVNQMSFNSISVLSLFTDRHNVEDKCINETEGEGYFDVFPPTIALAATFNTELAMENGKAVSEEIRSRNNSFKKTKYSDLYSLLNVFEININVLTDVLSARAQETFGEDPYLTSKMSYAFCRGIKEGDNEYPKLMIAPKYSINKSNSSDSSENISKKQLLEEYLPALEKCVKEMRTDVVVCSCEEINYCTFCTLELLNDILYEEWDFQGYVICDCSQLDKNDEGFLDLVTYIIKKGFCLNHADSTELLMEALKKGDISEKIIDTTTYKLMAMQMKLEASYASTEEDSNSEISFEKSDYTRHQELNKQITKEGIVLLKNDRLLPLEREDIRKVTVIGPYPDEKIIDNHLAYKTVYEGVKAAHAKAETIYVQGCGFNGDVEEDESLQLEAVWAAQESDIVILTLGFPYSSYGIDTINDTDNRTKIYFPMAQEELMEAVCGVGVPVILLNFTSGFVDLTKAEGLCRAILQCWHTDQFVGEVMGKMIFGDFTPSGKLPLTFYKDADNLFDSNPSVNKTYRYYEGETLYPFGFGLNYSFIEYYRIYLSESKIKVGDDIIVTVFCKNKGKYDTKEVVQVYLVDEETAEDIPLRKLVALKKVFLAAGDEKKVSLKIKSDEMALINKEGERIIEPGRFSIYVGGGQSDDVTAKLYNRDCLHIGFLVE